MRSVTPSVQMFTGLFIGRSYLVTGNDVATIIDTGTRSASRPILRQLRKAGYRLEEVHQILITHAHTDHIGALPALKPATGAEVMSCEEERPYIEGERGLPKADGTRTKPMPGTPVDRLVEDGEVLDGILGGLQCLHTPGHTPGGLSFWAPNARVLFCGDVMTRMFGRRIHGAPKRFTADEAQNRASIRRLIELEPDIVCFGHGPPLVGNTVARLRAFGERIGVREENDG